MLAGMLRVLYEHGVAGASVERVTAAAGVSRRTFYELYADRGECLVAALEQELADVAALMREACSGERTWVGRIRAGLYELLEFFDAQPALARVCVIEAPAAGEVALKRRSELMAILVAELDEGRALNRDPPSPVTAEGLVEGVIGVVHMHMLAPKRRPMRELLNPLMSFITLPYLGAGTSRRELNRVPPPRRAARRTRPRSAENPFAGLPLRLTNRTVGVLHAIAAKPGLNNRQLGELAGIVDKGQTSKLLARLAGLELIVNTGGGQPVGAANAWYLTPRGMELQLATAGSRRGV
jgi:AcrR family transcriptional regulator